VDNPQTPGVHIIETALATMPNNPGVYRMLDAKGDVLYVGKARNLKKRVTSYTQLSRLPERLRRMVAGTAAMEIVTTHTEVEALLLEANLIKRLKPRYNILLRDDKSFPWLVLTANHPYPQLAKHRGAQTRKGAYFGPFASAGSVNQSVQTLQRSFLLRTCADTVFTNRTRPCLLFQIKRCSAPCVGRISEADYAVLVEQAKTFLSGKSGVLQKELAVAMQTASDNLDFEQAAMIRDRIKGLTHLQGTEIINPASMSEADVIAVHQEAGQACVQVFFIRGGRNNGNRSFYPANTSGDEPGTVLAAFIAQFYDDKPPPPQILLNYAPDEGALLAEALSLKAQRKVALLVPQRGEKYDVVQHAATNAREALERKLAEAAGQGKLLAAAGELFALPETPTRIETYDNSHIMGTNAYGVMVVAGPEGYVKSAYRKFSIRSAITPGDDFGMMREVLQRRFGRTLAEDPNRESEAWPDLLLIDGGAGQLSAVQSVMAELGLEDIPIVAIAKGPDRNAGREWFHIAGREPFQLPERDPVLYFLQRLRDEAHRFAITTHRAGRAKKLTTSELDEVPGVGAARKKALLQHFGSAREVKNAGLKDLEAVAGVNRATARAVYAFFHPGVRLPQE
jgi:excinuclease ABC subunit C